MAETPQLHSKANQVGDTVLSGAETPNIKLSGQWCTGDGQIDDISLQDCIAVRNCAKYLPYSAGHCAAQTSTGAVPVA